MLKLNSFRYSFLSTLRNSGYKVALVAAMTVVGVLGLAQGAFAHHPMGGTTPTNFVSGFLSGLGHPVIGLDHFAFVVASGLVAAGVAFGFMIPVAFVLTAMLGTGIHIASVNIPAVEIIIATSVLAFGLLLVINNQKEKQPKFYNIAIAALAANAGVFHGYAYGESITGAEMSPLVAYLAGFTLIQLIIAGAAYFTGRQILKHSERQSFPIMRFLGLIIGAIGVVFLTSAAIA